MNPTRLLQFFESHRNRQEPLVLATVYETRGSTYSKAGAHMLIDGNGIFQGMLSGGCLEGDLAIRAQVVLETRAPQTVTYDLGQGDDELWGFGVGCDGLMRVFLQPIGPGDAYRPFSAIADVLRGASSCVVAIVIESGLSRAPVGATLQLQDGAVTATGFERELLREVTELAQATLQDRQSQTRTLRVADEDVRVLATYEKTPPRILLLGAGIDAEPVVSFVAAMGWLCTVVDHRPAYIDNGNFSAAAATHRVVPDELAESLDLAMFDMAVVMSHHLASDRSYLRQLARTDIRYIGLLGPPGRRARILAELGEEADGLSGRLKGPVGLDLGGRGPAAIALSIVAQMQMELGGSGN